MYWYEAYYNLANHCTHDAACYKVHCYEVCYIEANTEHECNIVHWMQSSESREQERRRGGVGLGDGVNLWLRPTMPSMLPTLPLQPR